MARKTLIRREKPASPPGGAAAAANRGPRISLEQWRALVAVVDAGGYAQAAERLHKSQSAVSHAVQKLESVLGVEAFRIDGRKAVLTDTGQLLYRRGQALMRMRVVPMAAPGHPLHALGRPLTLRDLRAHRHIVVRDTGSRRTTKSPWLEAKQRWTLSHIATSIEAVASGYGFAWFVE